jgi:UDPglucose--hexose-1-phosphate uridylyltransferase
MAENQSGLDLQTAIHRRLNPLTSEWVLISPRRTDRPWQGQTEAAATPAPSYAAACYLCPGNARAGGHTNPSYDSTFVFDNDFAALDCARSGSAGLDRGLLQARGESGRCRVVSYSPHHDASMGRMDLSSIRRIVDCWAHEYESLGRLPQIKAVTIFENRGAMMGASSPHPHGQVWASESIPDLLLKESAGQQKHLESEGSCLLCDYVALELVAGDRIVALNEQFVVVVPFWAVWPYETLMLPRVHATAMHALDSSAREGLSRSLKDLVARYDALFGVEFPYTMGWHQQPTDGGTHGHWHLHAHFYPPLLRSASVRKFMVGYEMLAEPQRDTTPEVAAARLRLVTE